MIREDTDRFGWLVRLSFSAVMKGVNDPHSKQPHSQCVCTWCVRNFVRCVRHVHEYSYKIQTIDAYNDLSGICPSSISNITLVLIAVIATTASQPPGRNHWRPRQATTYGIAGAMALME